MRFVLDTNLLVSGVIATGLPRRLIDGAKAGEFELCTSEVLLAELLEVLSRDKFAARLTQAKLTPQVIVSPTDTPRVVPTDPDDDHVIAAAVTGQADLIASGDKRDLLPLGHFAGIDIVTAREAVERLEARGKTCSSAHSALLRACTTAATLSTDESQALRSQFATSPRAR